MMVYNEDKGPNEDKDINGDRATNDEKGVNDGNVLMILFTPYILNLRAYIYTILVHTRCSRHQKC